DVVRHAPHLEKLVDVTGGKAELRFVTRASRPEYFVRYLPFSWPLIKRRPRLRPFLCCDYII
ncbi:hypothetical protein BVY04_01120, partial [bacterium M21]